MKRLLLLLLLCTSAAGAQTMVVGDEATHYRESTYANRPVFPFAGLVVIFTDAPTSADCSAGGGTARALCRYTGSAWEALGGSASSFTAIASDVLPSVTDTYALGNPSFRWNTAAIKTGTFGTIGIGSGTLGDTAGALIQVPNNSTWLSAKKNGAGSCDIGINTSNQFTFSCPGVFSGDMLTLPSVAGDAAAPVNGATWYNTSTNKFRCRENGATVDCIGTGSGAPFADNAALVKNNSDNTKLFLISAASITTGTTRTATVPNKDFTFAGAGGTLTNGTVACINSTGDFLTCSSVGTALTLASQATSGLTVQTGNASTTNNAGALIVRGGNNVSASTGSGGSWTGGGGDQTLASTGGSAGSATLRGGDSAGNGSTTAGDLILRPGGGSAATPSVMGKLIISETYGDGGTVTSGKLACMAGDLTVADCATSATNAIGLTISASDTNPVIVQLLGRNNVAITLDVTSAGDCNGTNCTTTVGHYVCTSANTAGTVQVATGPTTAPCAAHRIVGIIVKAESGVTTLAAGNVALRMGAR